MADVMQTKSINRAVVNHTVPPLTTHQVIQIGFTRLSQRVASPSHNLVPLVNLTVRDFLRSCDEWAKKVRVRRARGHRWQEEKYREHENDVDQERLAMATLTKQWHTHLAVIKVRSDLFHKILESRNAVLVKTLAGLSSTRGEQSTGACSS